MLVQTGGSLSGLQSLLRHGVSINFAGSLLASWREYRHCKRMAVSAARVHVSTGSLGRRAWQRHGALLALMEHRSVRHDG